MKTTIIAITNIVITIITAMMPVEIPKTGLLSMIVVFTTLHTSRHVADFMALVVITVLAVIRKH